MMHLKKTEGKSRNIMTMANKIFGIQSEKSNEEHKKTCIKNGFQQKHQSKQEIEINKGAVECSSFNK